MCDLGVITTADRVKSRPNRSVLTDTEFLQPGPVTLDAA